MKELVIANAALVIAILIETAVNFLTVFTREARRLKDEEYRTALETYKNSSKACLDIIKKETEKLDAIAQKKGIFYIQYDASTGQFNRLVEITPEEAWSLRAEMQSEHKEEINKAQKEIRKVIK